MLTESGFFMPSRCRVGRQALCCHHLTGWEAMEGPEWGAFVARASPFQFLCCAGVPSGRMMPGLGSMLSAALRSKAMISITL